jgi:hypothetical protein
MGVPVKNLKLIVDNEHNPVPEGRNANTANSDQFLPLVGLSLGSFLQAMSMDQQTCVLEICRDGDRGSFYFVQGTLHDAACSGLDGEEAALELISWEGVSFNIKKIPDKSQVPRKINKSLISLLMDSTRQMDEKTSPEFDPDDAAEESETGLKGAAHNADADLSEGPGQAAATGVPESETETDIRVALQQCVDRLVQEIPDALFRSVIIDFNSGEVLAGQGVKLSALDYYAELNRMFGRVARAHCSEPGRYFLLNIDDSRTIVFLNFHSIRWAVDFDSKKMKLGVFLNIMAPKLAEWCESALQTDK